MSANPSMPSPATLATAPPSSLATLLAESYQELESLRRELAHARKCADKAEHLSSSLQALFTSISEKSTTSDGTNFPETATRILMDFEDRAIRAELAKDEAEAQKRVLMDTWSQLNHYLVALSEAAADARAGYAHIVAEGGGQLVLAQIPVLPTGVAQPHLVARQSGGVPAFQSMALSPHPQPHVLSTGTRRPRTLSIDGYQQPPPSKKFRVDDKSMNIGESSAFSLYQGEHHRDRHAPHHNYPPPSHLHRTAHRSQGSQPRHAHLAPPTHLPQAQAQARMIFPPHRQHHYSYPQSSRHHRTSHSRSRSSSSAASLSVDEMLLQASSTVPANEDGVGTAPPLPPSPGTEAVDHIVRASTLRGTRRIERDMDRDRHESMGHVAEQHTYHQHRHPATSPHDSPSTSYRNAAEGNHSDEILTKNAGGTGSKAREFQTHIFAPPVTGAPTKKSKYVAPEPPIPPANPENPAAPFPSVNAQGQRICRQCGVAGRYKEGKCVEKWGPGPMGPGTVCDRCRKKMKRIERRGTIGDSPSSVPASEHSLHHPHTQSQSPTIHRTDTHPAQSQHPPSSTTTPNRTYAGGTPASPSLLLVKDDEITITTSEIGRGNEAAAAASTRGSRSNPRNGHPGAKGGGTMLKRLLVGASTRLRVQRGFDIDTGGDGEAETEADVDADADAEADAHLEVKVAVLHGVAAVGKGTSSHPQMDADAEADFSGGVKAVVEVNSTEGEGDNEL